MRGAEMIPKACNGDRPNSAYRELLTVQDCILLYVETEKPPRQRWTKQNTTIKP